MREMKDFMKNNVSNAISVLQLELELKKAAAMEAGQAIMACMENATDDNKPACFDSTEVKEAIANATGIALDDLTERKIREFVERSARAATADLMKTCQESAADAQAKRQCLADAKGDIEKLMGGSVDGAKVQRFMREGAGDDLLKNMKACQGGKSREDCMSEMKRGFGQSMGKSGDPSKFEMDRSLREAAARKAKELMDACKDDMR